MKHSKWSRRDLIKLGGLGTAASLISGCQKSSAAAGTTSAKTKEVKGVVFMVSDGMSHGVLTMAEQFSNITRGRGTRWWELINEDIAVTGLMETSSADSLVTDSAAASSAWGGGAKINNGAINIRPDGSESIPIMRQLKQLGRKTGLVTSTRITHATPAGFATVAKSRNDETIIAPQYLNVVDVLLGGGMKFFDPKQRLDSRDALEAFQKSGYELMDHRDSLMRSTSDRVLGLFHDDHLPYEVDRLNDDSLKKRTPTLAEMSEFALSRFLAGEEKFLLQIEGGRVDHAAHHNDAAGLLWDQLAFDDAIAKVLELIAKRDDILVIVTSDHGNANPGLNGTGPSYQNTNKAFKNITRMTASYESLFMQWGRSENNNQTQLEKIVQDKLGFKMKPEESEMLYSSLTGGDVLELSAQLKNPGGLLGQIAGNHTGIGWTGVSHTSDPTILTSVGPQSSRFHGITRNDAVHGHLLELLG